MLNDIDKYNQHKMKEDDIYKKASNLVYMIRKEVEEYPRVRTFRDDLYYIGFDLMKDDSIPSELVNDQIKLLDLVLSFAYTK